MEKTAAVEKVYELFLGENSSSSIEKYDKNAEFYNSQLSAVGYANRAPKAMAEMLMKHIKNEPSTRVLDVGAGTGLVGLHLRSLGFTGSIDGVDGSVGMLNELRKLDGVYAKVKCHFIRPGEPIADFGIGIYDALTCSGCFSAPQFDPKVLLEFLKHLKLGGILIYNSMNKNSKYLKNLEDQASILEKNGTLRKVNISEVSFYSIEWKHVGKTANQYCYENMK